MTFSSLVTRKVTTPNESTRRGAKPRYIVHHHEAGTSFEAVIESWRTGRKQGSCHITISNEGEAVGIVPEQLRAWSLSSATFDGFALVTEIENESGAPNWAVSALAHEKAAQVTADWCQRYEIPCTREFVIDHGEVYTRHHMSYPTACAGGLNLDWIVARAMQIMAGGKIAAPSSPPVVAAVVNTAPARTGWSYWEPTGALARRVQAALKGKGRYAGPLDGVFGEFTRRGVQQTLAFSGEFKGLIDGLIQGGGCLGIQTYAKRFGDYTGPLDAAPRTASWTGLALGLERP